MCVRPSKPESVDLSELVRRPQPRGLLWPRPKPQPTAESVERGTLQFLEVISDRLAEIRGLIRHIELDAALADVSDVIDGIDDWCRLRREAA